MASLLLIVIYLSFISLGLPDSLLGAVWPALHRELDVPLGWSGIVFMLIAAGTVVSSLLSDRLSRRMGAGRLTACSVGLTCAALFGFSLCRSFPALCLAAIPYGLGAGGVDAALNNYVALHYASRHMSWLHCMWGVGASIGPWILSAALAAGSWSGGYRTIGFLQLGLTAVLLLSLPLWKAGPKAESVDASPLSLRQILSLPGAGAVMICFFCYCGLEQTASLWASSYLAECRGVEPAAAAARGSLFFLGITAGRALSGFLTFRLSDRSMIRLGLAVVGLGTALLILSPSLLLQSAALVILGLGCAPVYPCVIHSTPAHFGAGRSQAVIGVEMASAYIGTSLVPPLFGLIAGKRGPGLFPVYLLLLLLGMILSHERLCRQAEHHDTNGG